MLDSNFYGTWYRKFALKPLAQAGCFEYHKPHKQLSYKGPIWTIMRFPLSQICQTTPKLLRQVFYIMYHENYYQAYWKVHFSIFQPTLSTYPMKNVVDKLSDIFTVFSHSVLANKLSLPWRKVCMLANPRDKSMNNKC